MKEEGNANGVEISEVGLPFDAADGEAVSKYRNILTPTLGYGGKREGRR